jgi:hypothetical protein
MAAKDTRFGDLVARAPSDAATRHASKHAEKQAKKESAREREREREIRQEEEMRPGVSTGGDQISALPQERSRAVSYPSGFQGCFLMACGVRGRVTRTQLLVITTYQGPFHRPELMPFQTAVMVLLGPVPEHMLLCTMSFYKATTY